MKKQTPNNLNIRNYNHEMDAKKQTKTNKLTTTKNTNKKTTKTQKQQKTTNKIPQHQKTKPTHKNNAGRAAEEGSIKLGWRHI